MELLERLDCANSLGEGVQWNPDDNAVWWTDIQAARLHRYRPASGQFSDWELPDRLGAFAFIHGDSGGEQLLAAFATGLARYRLDTGGCQWLARPEEGVIANRFNDGRADRQGRFWAGTLVEDPEAPPGGAALYCLDQEQLRCPVRGLTISNGLCWSPDSHWMYHADSTQRTIYAYPYDPDTGQLGERRIFARTPEGIYPDGACVDAQGYLWSAQWGGGRVVRYAPDGSEDRVLSLPVSQTSCVAFGGPDLDWLLVTSARDGLDAATLAKEPLAGSLFIYASDVRGLPESRYRPLGESQ